MDLSVIIPVYNAAALIDRCLDSVFSQKTRYTFEVILIDDGSTDNSVDLINARKEMNIILYKQRNAGPAAARNKGVELAQGRYCAYLDADDYWNDGYIEKTVAFLDTHEECVAISVGCKSISFGNAPSYCPYTLDDESKDAPFVLEHFYEYWTEYGVPGTCSTTLRTEMVKKSGGMRIDLRVTEDYEFWLYMATFGKWGVIPQVLYVSDGGIVNKIQGHVKKNIERARKSPTVDDFEKRIVARVPEEERESYRKALGRVARVLVYSYVITDRFALGRNETLRYGSLFPKDKIGRLMNLVKYTALTWWCLAYLLRWREYHR
ncbi:MAG: glycosyltransferase family 2 protein [Paraprevotella sp.]|nr:glycosyltransferase family 2 protein [Paraprevotella sp.]